MGFEPARERYIASQKPNALPTELSGRPKLYSYFYLSPGNRVAAYWEIAAHSAYDYVFPPRFLEWEFLSDCAFS